MLGNRDEISLQGLQRGRGNVLEDRKTFAIAAEADLCDAFEGAQLGVGLLCGREGSEKRDRSSRIAKLSGAEEAEPGQQAARLGVKWDSLQDVPPVLTGRVRVVVEQVIPAADRLIVSMFRF